MKTSYTSALVLAFAALTAGQAMAADNNTVGKTRAQVQSELAQYKADHKNDVYDSEFGHLISSGIKAAPSSVTRAQVMAELAADKKAHQFDVYDSEFGQLVNTAASVEPASTLTRAQVRAELAEYISAHKYDARDTEFNLRLN